MTENNKIFELVSKFKPQGSQPEAIDKLTKGILEDEKFQTLLGVTGSGKTFTIANVIANTGKKTLVLAHNKTLAAQLYSELKGLFPNNRVEYFVSFYDYYQPESYIASKDQYIEKDSQINTMIERMRLSTTTSLISRDDVIVVASVSCIYGLGNPANYKGMGFDFEKGMQISRSQIIKKLIAMQYERNDIEFTDGRFRVKGDTIDIIPGGQRNVIRIELFGDEIDRISELGKENNNVITDLDHYHLFPARHFVTPEGEMDNAIKRIRDELEIRLPQIGDIEAHRLKQRTNYDVEMMETMGFCKGIENYSRHLEGRGEGEKPYCLLDYFGDDFLIVIDESHQSAPQVRAMYNGDRKRKESLIEHGFRLPSALDNRPLQFMEFEDYYNKANTIYVSATPALYELEKSNKVVEQIIRPTGLIDPEIEIRKTEGQMDDLEKEISNQVKNDRRVLVTCLTKKLAEEITDYLASKGVRSRYLHSEVKTLERTEIIRELRLGKFDVLVGINLLREGIDIPEVGMVTILDADKEGFLRDRQSLIQIIGRAARNSESKVIMYADKITDSMKLAIEETERRRKIQTEHNEKNNIVPTTVIKAIDEQKVYIRDTKHIPRKEKENMIKQMDKEMRESAERLDFENAVLLRDRINELKKELEN